jgi:cyanate permease
MQNAFFGASFFVIGPITPYLIDDYKISHGAAGLLTASVILAQSALSIPFSILIGRVRLKTIVSIGWILSAAPAITILTDNFTSLLVTRIVYGVALAAIIPAQAALVISWFDPRERLLMNALITAAAPIAMTISTMAAAPLADVIGWKLLLTLLGLLNLLGSCVWIFFGKSEGELLGQNFDLRSVWVTLRSKTALLLAAADAGPFAQYCALVAWLPTFYFEKHGFSLAQAGSMVGLLPLAGGITLLVISFLSMTIRNRRRILLYSGIAVGVSGFGTFLLAGTSLGYLPLIVLGATSWLYLPVLITIAMEIPGLTTRQVSIVCATILSIGGILSFTSPFVVGILHDWTASYLPGFSLFATLAWSLVLCATFLPKTHRIPRIGGSKS